MLFKKPAAIVKQGSLTIFATSFNVGDFMRPNFYLIDKLDPDEPSSGYQRVLDSRRTKKISGYFTKAWKDGWLTCLDTTSGKYWQANQRGETRWDWLLNESAE